MFQFIDLFAGIGGIRLAFEKAGGQCVFSSEWNKFCQITYEANFGEKPEGDITEITSDKIPHHDILLAGFPCQPFSIAGVSKKLSLGKEHGFNDQEQGNLFFQIERILAEKRPRAFLLENVKNLLSHDKKRTFDVIKNILEKLEYEIFYEVIDAAHYVPQHRERIYIVGFDKRRYQNIQFQFSVPAPKTVRIVDILEPNVEDSFTLSDKLWSYLQAYAEKHRKKGNGFGFGLVDPVQDSVTRTLSARYYKDGSEILIRQEGKNPRMLTPRECARLMGFEDTFQIPVSKTQAYKQFGNSVVVPVVHDIAQQMMRVLEDCEKSPNVRSYYRMQHHSPYLKEQMLQLRILLPASKRSRDERKTV